MTTRDEVLDALDRIEKSGGAGDVADTARIELLSLPPQYYDRILARLQAAYPGLLPPGAPAAQYGAGIEAMKRAETALAHQQSATADFDRRVLEALCHAHKTTVDGRRELEELTAQIDDAARGWDLGTAAGAREFQRFLLAKLDRIMQVVEEANDDDVSKRELAAALAARYDEQTGRPAPPLRQPAEPPPAGPDPGPAEPAAAADPVLVDDAGVFDGPGYGGAEPAGYSAVPAPAPPAGPGFGGGLPAAGGIPGGGVPGGFSLGGLPVPPRRAATPADPEAPAGPAAAAATDAADDDETAGSETAVSGTAPADPTVVTLPDGETVHAGTPRLAAVLQAAVGGTPIDEAFRAQGVTIPPPGTPVTAAVDPSRVAPGDIGMFTDRHALVLGNEKALLDGQIQRIANVRGPSFLGWQHPPALPDPATVPTATEPPQPTPIRPPAVIAQPGR